MLHRHIHAWLLMLALIQANPGWSQETGPAPGHSAHGDAFDEGPRQKAYLMKGTGNVHFPISSKAPLAQKFFDQGVGQLHGFWYLEAERSFRQVAALDTNCAMAYWGMGMANVNNAKRARAFMTEATKRRDKADAREKLWIDAYANFRKDDKKEEKDKRRELVRALEKILHEYPSDLEARAFLAYQIWDNHSKGVPISSHESVDALIAQVLSVEPMHPAHHYAIHLWDGEKPVRALPSAARAGQSSPGIAHMWHMPGHTFSKVHRYADAAWQQEASARMDHAHMMRDQILPDEIHNYAHNNEWLVRDLSIIGRAHDAVSLAKNMIELPRLAPKRNEGKRSDTGTNSSNSGYAESRGGSYSFGRSRLLEVLVRYELWSELIALSRTRYLSPSKNTDDELKRQCAIGVAHFSLTNLTAGREVVAALESQRAEQQRKKQEAEDKAENKAKDDKKSESDISKAKAEAGRSFTNQIGTLEVAIAELKSYEAVARGNAAAFKEQVSKTKDIPKDRLARLHWSVGDRDKAEQLAMEAMRSATNQVQPLANYVDILHRNNKFEEAFRQFYRLRDLSAQADLDVPVFQRLKPVAKALDLPNDWRPKATFAADSGKRPPLKDLGPFRWQPSPAPEWKLADRDGKPASLRDYHGKPVVVVFYLGHGCSHCIQQLQTFKPRTGDFANLGISLVGISTDSVAGLKETFAPSKLGEEFPFPLLSDKELKAFKSYRAFDDFENMPLHGTFLVDRDGLVRWRNISFEPFTNLDFLLEEAQRLLELPEKTRLAGEALRTASR